MSDRPVSTADFNALGTGALPALMGLEITSMEPGEVTGRMPVRPDLLAPNGYLHAASVIALVDTMCGYGCVRTLPEAATGFTTVELKTNFMGTLLEGVVTARAWLVHGGRTTQVWDAEATDDTNGRTLALFRCTQMLLYPR